MYPPCPTGLGVQREAMKLNKSKSNQSLLSLRRGVLKSQATQSELRIKALLEGLGVAFCFQKGFYNSATHYIVDFYFPKHKKLCLEIDGGYHLDPQQIAYDSRRTQFLEDVRGFRVKRLTNQEADQISPEDLLAFISPYEKQYDHIHPFEGYRRIAGFDR